VCLLKYKSLVRPGRLAAELVDVEVDSRTAQASQRCFKHALHYRHAPRAVPQLETERLLDRLRRLKLAAPAVVVNAMTLGPGRCRRCRATTVAERRTLAALRRRCALAVAPVRYHPDSAVRAVTARRESARTFRTTLDR
jgi:hypothetical protein